MIRTLVAIYVYFWRLVTSYYPYGKSVFSEDWDLLIVLDGCRVDALQEVQSEFEFVTGVDSITSQGSTSKEWIDNTFIKQHQSIINETTYISANGFSFHIQGDNPVDPLDSSELNGTFIEDNRTLRKLINNRTVSGSLNEFTSARAVIRDSRNNNSDFDREIFPPDLVTNQAITTGRDDQPERMIVHYMQPHAPFISSALERGYLKEHEKSPYSYLKEGGDFETIWEAYLNNLRFVLDEVGRLLDNTDADSVVITADHGELFGEWNLYSHTYGVPHPNLRSVPWVETSAVDTGCSYPEGEISQYEIIPDEEVDVEDRLNALGYK